MLVDHLAQPLPPRARHDLAGIHAGVGRMQDLLNCWLNIARCDHAVLRRTRVDLSVIAESLVRELQMLDPKRSVIMTVDAELSVSADPVLVRELLQNLLSNAWKFTTESSPAAVHLGARIESGETVFYVRDNSVGFAAEDAAQLFVPKRAAHARRQGFRRGPDAWRIEPEPGQRLDEPRTRCRWCQGTSASPPDILPGVGDTVRRTYLPASIVYVNLDASASRQSVTRQLYKAFDLPLEGLVDLGHRPVDLSTDLDPIRRALTVNKCVLIFDAWDNAGGPFEALHEYLCNTQWSEFLRVLAQPHLPTWRDAPVSGAQPTPVRR